LLDDYNRCAKKGYVKGGSATTDEERNLDKTTPSKRTAWSPPPTPLVRTNSSRMDHYLAKGMLITSTGKNGITSKIF